MLERHEIEAFLTLGSELHFGRTAERLHVSTTRISQTIAKLERRIGMPLFHRTSRRVTLTEAGRRLRDELLPAWDQVIAAVQRATGRLNAAFVGAAGGQLMLQTVAVYQQRHPAAEVPVREAQLGEYATWLRDGLADVALIPYPVETPGLVPGGTLITEARMLAVPAEHPLATLPEIPAATLASFPGALGASVASVPGVPAATQASVPDAGLAFAPGMPAGGLASAPGMPASDLASLPVLAPAATFQELLTCVGSGRGVLPVGAHVRRYYARPDVAYVPLTGAEPVRWGLAWHEDRAGPRVLAFNQAAHDVVTGVASAG